MGILRVLDEDTARLAQIEIDVNLLRAALGLPPFPGGDIISGCVQVGLNAITNGRDVVNTASFIPELSVVGLPFTYDNVPFPTAIDDRVNAISTDLGVTTEELASLVLHAGCLQMLGETDNKGFRPSFV